MYDPSPATPIKNYSIGKVDDLDNLIGFAVLNQGYISVPRERYFGAIKILRGGDRFGFNMLSLYVYRYSGYLINESHIFYTMDGDTLPAGPYASGQDTLIYSKSFNQMVREFPALFNPRQKEKLSYKKHDFSVSVSKQVFEPYTMSFVPGGQKTLSNKHYDKEGDYRVSNSVLIDSVAKRITIVYGRVQKGVRYNEFKEFYFVTRDIDDRVTADFKMEFEFPRTLHSEFVVYDNRQIQPKPAGKLFVFTYQQMFSAKQSDPVKNNFNIIYTDVNGNLIFSTNTTFETLERAILSVNGAFDSGDHLILSYSISEKKDWFFGIAKIDRKGEINFVKIPYAEAEKKMEKIHSSEDAEFLKSRSVLKDFAITPGLRISINTSLKLTGSVQTKDANYFWGHTIYTIDDPAGPPKRSDGSIIPGIFPKLDLTGEFIVLKYDKDFKMLNGYFHNLPLTSEGYNIYPAEIRGNSLFFTIPLKSSANKGLHFVQRRFYDEKKVPHPNYPYDVFYNPLVISFGDGKYKNKILRDIFLLLPDKPFMYSHNFASLAIIGFSREESSKTYLEVISMDDMIFY